MYDILRELITMPWFIGSIILVVSLSLFLFWRALRISVRRVKDGRTEEEIEADSRRWGFRAFDLAILSILGALFIARVCVLIVNPDVFDDVRWFWLPYEKIDGDVMIFGSLPWLLFRLWDVSLPIQSLVLGWMVSVIALSRLMRVPWGFVSNSISDVFWVIFIAVQIYFGVLWEVVGPLLVVIPLVLLGIVKFLSQKKLPGQKGSKFDMTISVIWKLTTIVGLPSALLVYDYFYRTIYAEDFFVFISIASIGLGFWLMSRELIEYVKILRYGEGTLLSPVIVPVSTEVYSSGVVSGWRRFLREQPEKKVFNEKPVKRDFSLTYKDYTKPWEQLWERTIGAIFRNRNEVGKDEDSKSKESNED